MNNSFGGAGDLVAVTDRLESLNSVLGGIRTALFCADEKTEGLVEKCSSLERDLGALSAPSQEIELLREQLAELRLEVDRELEGKEGQGSDVSLRIEELNGLMDSIRSTITVELGAIKICSHLFKGQVVQNLEAQAVWLCQFSLVPIYR